MEDAGGPMSNKIIQVFWLMILQFFYTACAGKTLLVKNADNLLEHQVVKRIPLYTAQREKLDADIKKFLNEKRNSAPEILPVVDEITLDHADKLDTQYRKIAKVYDQLALDFTAIIAKYMGPLDSKQQKDFFKTLEEENRKLASTDKEDRMEKIQGNFRTFFGSIDEKQKQLLVDMQTEFESNNQSKLERREVLFQKLKEIYKGELSPASTSRQILETFISYQKNAHNHDKNVQMLQKILPTINPRQKEFFRKRVAEVKEVLKLYLETDY